MKLELDRAADAAYVALSEDGFKKTRKLDQNRLLDLDESGAVVGIEFLNISGGVDLRDLPRRGELRKLFDERQINQLT